MSNNPSSYLNYLPANFQEDPFVGRFLLALERVMSGFLPRDTDDPNPEQLALEEYIDRIPTYFNPYNHPDLPVESEIAPTEFIPWLASWVALSLRDDWSEETKRRFISNIVPLYRQRGTKAGVKQMLELYTQEEVKIYEFEQPAHYFQVTITLNERDPKLLQRQEEIAKAIVNQEKPAHTFYALRVLIPGMQIINQPTESKPGIIVGETTLLGTTTIS
ncbi:MULTISPECIES: phage tail protein I [Moorena]|uniref:Phage tail protein domain protein n=1 Tax=Moorena producens 3L TaxID=489825 RepID=F4XRU7_9CYAN|nr:MULTISPECIES: phage tail protein I [Moorena]NEQ15499.1 phage tail protein I [Moorena sp. SIO3E2]EGJ32666.1 phage tail protein domain protein [Moorena producens 3L]NEP65171.1 phage tail protein I [Moorena sp. SIO3A5]NER87849.1 phage tail protein I [Moorena sp. SIO3A2]NES41551.1 phage tail protein I [Moorena sp. SIO2C4]